MRKLFNLILPFFFMLAIAAVPLGAYASSTEGLSYGDVRDKNGDGIITYSDLNVEMRKQLQKGYSTGLRNGGYGNEMMYVMEGPVIRVMGTTPASENVPSYKQYQSQVSRTQSYYGVIRSDRKLYPRDTDHWFVTEAGVDENGEWVATVNCTAGYTYLTTPETIYYDGHKCKVTGLNLTNAYVLYLTITDNIKSIKACRCPYLIELTGGRNVVSIGDFAFKDCVFMVNFPYFPYLERIGKLAFEGCYNLSEILLPPLITYIDKTAFGWYDVVQGNYDYFTLRGDVDEFNDLDAFANRERILGVTLYAVKNTYTWDTINALYTDGGAGVYGSHIKVKEKNNYPGPFEIDVIEEITEYLPWTTPDVGKDIEWKDLDFDISDIGALTGSISEDARNTIGYLMDMVIAGDINEDMFYSLICAMTGFGDIPTDFVDEHYTDPEYMRLVELYSAAVKKQLKIQELRKSGDPVLSSKLENAMFEARSKDLEFVKARFEELSKVADVSQLTKITGYIDHLNTFFTYVNSGDTFSGAMAKSIGTGVYLKAVDSFAPLPIKVFEVVVATLFGKSKAGDAGSIVGTGKHSIEFFTDLVYVSMYDAWLNMDQFPDARKWDAFYTLWGMNVELVLKDLMNSSTTKYGQNLTNMAILVDMAIDPDDLKYVFTGYADRFAEGKVWNDYCKDTYETTVVGNEFGTLLYDFVVKYYSSSPDVLTDKAKYKDQIRKKTGTTK